MVVLVDYNSKSSKLDLTRLANLPFPNQQGVSFAPGTLFYPDGTGGENYLRLNFATQTPERIWEGMERLRIAIDRMEAG